MSDMGIEAPDADAAEQQQDVVPDTDDDVTPSVAPPLEANEADAAEQDQELDPGDDEYR
jgi:hypothetical protein